MRGLTVVALSLALAAAAAWASANTGRRTIVHGDRPAPAVRIYPTADRLPANLLRVYLVFDRPMSTGEARAHLTLLDDHAQPVERAFLQLDEELWDPSGRRLTVLFDPGRIKRGLKANLELGPPLVEGRRYTLIADAAWRDAEGRPLGAEAVKVFTTTAADRAVPVVDDWTIEPPPAGTRTPLGLRFPEALDRALLSSAIAVADPTGAALHGVIDVAAGERTWTFTPDRAWTPGTFELRVSSELEDVAGNSLRRVFDAEMRDERTAPAAVAPVVTRRFVVASGQATRR